MGQSMKPLSALLSQVFVAFVIECDNAFEAAVPHRTSERPDRASAAFPWLVSLGMWDVCLRHVDDRGTTVSEFARRAGLSKDATRAVLTRASRWWGYVELRPPPG